MGTWDEQVDTILYCTFEVKEKKEDMVKKDHSVTGNTPFARELRADVTLMIAMKPISR